MPKVSVVIPCYNSEPFIKNTLRSVLFQTFEDFEIIIIDDGSSDKTKEVIGAFSDTRIQYYYQDNQGISGARNAAMEYSSGEYVAFLDHDDEWLPDKLARQLKLFDKNPGLGLAFSDAYIESGSRRKITCFSERKPFRGNVFYEYLFSDNFVPLLTVLMPRAIISKYLPFDSKYQISEEFDIFLKVARDYKFDYLDEPLAVYHLHQENTIKKNSKRVIKEKFLILKYWLDREPAIKKSYRQQLNNRLAWLYSREGNYYLDCNNYNAVTGSIIKSFKYKKLNPDCMKLCIKLALKTLKIDYRRIMPA